jgi:hypothetical protein
MISRMSVSFVATGACSLSGVLSCYRTPEPKVVKNRAHIDIRAGLRRDEEVERLIGLGASLFADHREPDGSGFVVLADPDGNEFCVERGERDM